MGFDWDKYDSGGNYIKADEKKEIADAGIPFTVTAVRRTHKFENEQYELSVIIPDPATGEDEERVLAFAIGTGAESRDRMIAGIEEYLDGDGEEPIVAKLEKIGRGYYLRQA